jgi:hypothetical protein
VPIIKKKILYQCDTGICHSVWVASGLLVGVFIYFSSLHVSGIHVPIIRRKLLYLIDTGICHSVRMASGLLVGVFIYFSSLHVSGIHVPIIRGKLLLSIWISIQPAGQTPLKQSDKKY